MPDRESVVFMCARMQADACANRHVAERITKKTKIATKNEDRIFKTKIKSQKNKTGKALCRCTTLCDSEWVCVNAQIVNFCIKFPETTAES